jgi:hypothetical protein
MRTFCALLVLSLTGAPSTAFAADDAVSQQVKSLSDQVNQLTNMMKDLKSVVERQSERIESLEKENSALKAQTPPPSAAAPSALPAAAPAPVSAPVPSSSAAGRGGFTPDIGAVVDITGSLSESKDDEEGNDRISVRELELIISHDIDPYARFDSTITFSDFEDVDIEEAYVTYWEVPGGFQLRAGRLRPKIGKQSAIHRDQLDTVDSPLVIQRYLGVEGLFRTGLEVSHSLPQFAKPLTQEVTAGILEGGVGEDGTLFGETRRHPTFYTHLKNFFDIGDTTGLEVGGTYLLGSSDEDTYDVQALGADLTLGHFFTPIRKLKWQSEVYAQFRGDSAVNDNPVGFYSLLDLRVSVRWGFGLRYDWVQLVNAEETTGEDLEQAYSVYATFFQSEFARIRLQYQLADLAGSGQDNRLFLQSTFAVGAHKHKLQ